MLKSNFQRLIESWQLVEVKPYLQPLVVPKTSRYVISTPLRMNGVIPYGVTISDYWTNSKRYSGTIPVAPVNVGVSNRVFSGQAPNRGIYTGVK